MGVKGQIIYTGWYILYCIITVKLLPTLGKI